MKPWIVPSCLKRVHSDYGTPINESRYKSITIRIISGNNLYYVNEHDQIYGKHVIPSDSWKLLGAVELNNFSSVVRRFSVADIIAGVVPWKWKNGKQRCFILDFDHGHNRIWRSPSHEVHN